MWFFSRCISIDSLNTCFQQQKHKTSYDFCLCSERRNDEDDYDLLPKRLLRNNHHQQQIRRRFSKRYSDIVGPLSTKVYLPRTSSTLRTKQSSIPLSPHKHYRTSIKRNSNEIINSHSKKSLEILSSLKKTDQSIITHRYNSNTKHSSIPTNAVDHLAHRMQAAMSSELMYSLDRNFVFGDKKQSLNSSNINRSHSFHIPIQSTNDWWDKSFQKRTYHHMIPRVKECLDEEEEEEEKSISLDEPTPDYEEDEINNDDIGEEPTVDYDDLKSIPISEFEQTTPSHYDLGVSLSCNAPQTSMTPSSEIGTQEQSPIPPTPPPLPNTTIVQKKATFRCRTIADKITPNHKLILKDNTETITNVTEKNHSVPRIQEEDRLKKPHLNHPTIDPKPCHLHVSKEILEKTILRKVSHPVSRSYSTYGSMSQFNDHHTESTTLCQKSSTIDEQPLDGLSSSATTSIVTENEYEHRVSSKIYNDYKRRASLINVPTSNTLNSIYSHTAIIHPMHTHIGLRSSRSSSSTTNDKPNEMILSNKQMNICVINQLNQHLSTRFRKQQQEFCLKKNTNIIKENEDKTNVYDEPQDIDPTKSLNTSSSSIPPPPPPLPVGGFRSVLPQLNRPLSSSRSSITTLPHEINTSDLGCSTGTSTTSSKLSDTRILRELRTNPLFAKAKEHLEIEPGRLKETTSYLILDTCLKSPPIERFLMRPDELNPMIDDDNHKRINQQSELEFIFQKRAQRNLT